jgi:hypothetical protein
MKPKFLLAFDRDHKRKFVVHTQTPIVIAEVLCDENGPYLEAVTYEPAAETLRPNRLAGLMRRMGDWYRSTLPSKTPVV